MIESIVIGSETVPVVWDGEGSDEMDFFRDFLEELPCEDVPVSISICLS
jgi:hypothetical protein